MVRPAIVQRAMAVAARTVREAGVKLQTARSRLSGVSALLRDSGDLVEQIAQDLETQMRERVRAAFPDHGFFGDDGVPPVAPLGWVIEPLDGRENFRRGYPQYAMSMALVDDNEAVAAVVYDPVRGELFKAMQGEGATLNGRRITCVDRPQAAGSLAATVFAQPESARRAVYLAEFDRVHQAFAGVRRSGSTTLELAYLAAGRVDAFWAEDLPLRQLAAGLVLMREAGVAIVARDQAPTLASASLAAAPPSLIEAFLRLLDGQPPPR